MLLVDRRRILLLEAICQGADLLRQLNQTVLAEVISTIELTELNSSQSAKGQKHDHAHEVELDARLIET